MTETRQASSARPSRTPEEFMQQHEYQLLLTTCPDIATAENIAQALVSDHLAACVNILPITKSIYQWKGQVESAAEHLLIIKSLVRSYLDIEKRILELHPYELPEVIAVPVTGGFADYLAWIRDPDKT
jgi:periplasmic divalent cation tolerance protein